MPPRYHVVLCRKELMACLRIPFSILLVILHPCPCIVRIGWIIVREFLVLVYYVVFKYILLYYCILKSEYGQILYFETLNLFIPSFYVISIDELNEGSLFLPVNDSNNFNSKKWSDYLNHFLLNNFLLR